MKAAWHVGDTPYDIKASQVGGAGAIGVLTGVHTLQDLDKAATGVGECLACWVHCLGSFASLRGLGERSGLLGACCTLITLCSAPQMQLSARAWAAERIV